MTLEKQIHIQIYSVVLFVLPGTGKFSGLATPF